VAGYVRTFSDIMHYYSLRFEIEFDFCDAKQHFGLNDFKNYQSTPLKNFVSMSFFMTLYSKILLENQRKERNAPDLSIADIKTLYHVHFHYEYLLKYLLKYISQQPEKCFFISRYSHHYTPRYHS
ncbi:MAG: hypothetical protein NZ455_16580, partial [Bacteroidia bacterium]|nr:hypothetical protein [Bacteroidia bacterium]